MGLVGSPAVAYWDTPVNLGPVVNSAGDELSVALSADGIRLLLDSDRPGGEGGRDLYQSTWTGTEYGPPVNLGPSVNGPGREQGPTLSPDGTELVYVDPGWNLRLAVDEGSGWMPGLPLGGPVSSLRDEWAPRFDGPDALVFTRTGPGGNHDLLRTERSGGAWGSPVPVVASPFSEYAASVHGDSLFYAVGGDIHVAYRDGGEWTSPAPVPGLLNSSIHFESSPVLSTDGLSLYFVSDRDGGEGGYDVWVSGWVPGVIGVPDATPAAGLVRVHPNPFRSSTWVEVSGVAGIQVDIYDVGGRRVRSLRSGAGSPGVGWDGRDAGGHPVAPGVYVLRVTGAEGTRSATKVLRGR